MQKIAIGVGVEPVGHRETQRDPLGQQDRLSGQVGLDGEPASGRIGGILVEGAGIHAHVQQ